MKVMRGYFGVGLCSPRDPANVAVALRACGNFGAAFLAYSGRRYQRHAADTMKAYRSVPLHLAGDEPEDILRMLPFDCVPVAVEVDSRAVPLEHYVHPERALYLLGPEDGSIPESVIKGCRDLVRIPSLTCLNLGIATGVVLYDRVAKRAPNRTPYANGMPL